MGISRILPLSDWTFKCIESCQVTSWLKARICSQGNEKGVVIWLRSLSYDCVTFPGLVFVTDGRIKCLFYSHHSESSLFIFSTFFLHNDGKQCQLKYRLQNMNKPIQSPQQSLRIMTDVLAESSHYTGKWRRKRILAMAWYLPGTGVIVKK